MYVATYVQNGSDEKQANKSSSIVYWLDKKLLPKCFYVLTKERTEKHNSVDMNDVSF